MKQLINFLFFIWSFSPIMTLTDDNQFDEFIPFQENTEGATRKWRFSFFNFKFGTTILYLLTFTKTENDFIKILSLTRFQLNKNDAKSEGMFRKHIAELDEKALLLEKEALCYHIQTQQDRISTSNNKINIYTTIILTIIAPLFAIQKNQFEQLSFRIVHIVNIIIVSYSFLNICLYIFGSIKVQGILHSRFSDLRSSNEKAREIVIQYWFDWQQLVRKADSYVSYVKNLQHWIIVYLM